jgi:hypothetical protein
MTHSQARCVFTDIGYTGTPHPFHPPPGMYASKSKVVVFNPREVRPQFYALFKKGRFEGIRCKVILGKTKQSKLLLFPHR